MKQQQARSEYKKVWSALSTTEDQAKLHIIGVTEEDTLRSTGEQTLKFLQESVGIRKDDVVLEIGFGHKPIQARIPSSRRTNSPKNPR